MAQVREIPWDSCLLESRPDPETAARLRQESGRAPSGVFYFSAAPWLPMALGRLNACLLIRTHLSYELLDLIGLVVSQENSCRYCFAAQRALMIGLGSSRDHVDRVERDFRSAELAETDRLALEFARQIARANPLPTPGDREPLLAAGLSADAVGEIVTAVSIHGFFNRMSTLAALPPDPLESLPDRWFVRLLRPIAGVRLRSWKRTFPAVERSAGDGPFANVLASLGNLHTAEVFGEFVNTLWAADEISARAKALIFAVIARALGSAPAENEALQRVAAAGMPRQAAEAALTHLDSPELDAFERVALPFARETAWSPANQVPRLQARARELQAVLAPPEFAALLVTVALANSLCRVAAVAPLH